jgi:hypothetical protein
MPFNKLPKQDVLRGAEIAANTLIWLGVLIIAYGVISTFTGEPWRPVERFIVPVSATLTLLLIILNLLTVYLGFERLNRASGIERYVAVPVMAVLCLACVVLVWVRGMPTSVILGFAILGLAWALARVIPPQSLQEPAP